MVKEKYTIGNDHSIKNLKMFQFVKSAYSLYYKYSIKIKELEVPEDISHREIGYGYLKKVDSRNISFDNEKEYLKWILQNSPFHLYKSLSYMEYPEVSGGTSKKGIFKREIAFDIDVHRTNKCKHDESWICEHCLNEGKNQVFTLIEDYLFPDFGLSKDDIIIAFSGNRGYHIYLKPKSEDIKNMIEHWDRHQRRFFISYILGKNLNLNKVGSGWKRRLIKAFKKNRIGTTKFEKSNDWKKIIESRKNKDKIYKIIEDTKNRLELDEKVMEDDIRLLRVIGSLHGYTGFIVKRLKYSSLEVFNPLYHSVFSKFDKIILNVNIKSTVDDLEIRNNIYNHKSKEVPLSYILFLYGHGIDFEILDNISNINLSHK